MGIISICQIKRAELGFMYMFNISRFNFLHPFMKHILASDANYIQRFPITTSPVLYMDSCSKTNIN